MQSKGTTTNKMSLPLSFINKQISLSILFQFLKDENNRHIRDDLAHVLQPLHPEEAPVRKNRHSPNPTVYR